MAGSTLVPGQASEELQAHFEPMKLSLAPEKALQVAAAVAAVIAAATPDTTAQTQGAMERVGGWSVRKGGSFRLWKG